MGAQATTVTLDGLVDAIRARAGAARCLIALAGPPASGKSTLAERLSARLNDVAPGSAAILPMDGYHFDDRVLEMRGLRSRKGAPETFDVGGFRHMLQRLKRNEEAEIAVPVFDRDLEIARAGARLIPSSVSRIIVEGNYLLLERPPWRDLREVFDMTVTIDVPEAILRKRLLQRWRDYGLADEEVLAKVEKNDLPNARLVGSESAAGEFVLSADAAD